MEIMNNTTTKHLKTNKIMIWKEETPLQFLGSCIWNTSECLNIPLKRFAPIVFCWMIGVKGKKTKNK